MAIEGEDLEHMLDRRFDDFEKLVNAKLTSIESGVKQMQELFTTKVSNLHIDYVPRSEIMKDQLVFEKEITMLKKDVKRLEGWRNSLVGAVSIVVILIGWVIQSHFWK